MTTINGVRKRFALTATGTVLTFALWGCAGDGDPDNATGDRTSPAAGVDEFAQIFAAAGGGSYEPEESPQALADKSELVVVGRVTDVIPGRTVVTSETVSLVVQVKDEVTEADAPGVVYVELHTPGSLPAEEVKGHLPRDLEVTFFLNKAPTASEVPVLDEDAGRPAGFPLYTPISPQAFWIAEAGRVLQPLEGREFRDVDISQFLPPAEEYPEGVLYPGEGD